MRRLLTIAAIALVMANSPSRADEEAHYQTLSLRAPFLAMGFLDEGRTLASIHQGENVVRLWDCKKGKMRTKLSLEDQPRALAAADTGQRLAITLASGRVVIVDAAGLPPVYLARTASEQKPTLTARAFSPDGRQLVLGERGLGSHQPSARGKLYDVANGSLIRDFPLDTNDDAFLGFAATGQVFSVQALSGQIWLWDVASGAPAIRLGRKTQQPDDFDPQVQLAAESSILFVGGGAGADLSPLRRWQLTPPRELPDLQPRYHTTHLTALAVRRDGRRVYSGHIERPRGVTLDHVVRVINKLDNPDRRTPIGKVNVAHIWDAEAGKRLATLETPQLIVAVALSPNERRLAVATREAIYLWDVTALRDRGAK